MSLRALAGPAILLLSVCACDKKPAQEQAAPASASAAVEAPPHIWKDVPRKADTPRPDAGSTRENISVLKEQLKAKAAAGTATEREKTMLGVLCKNLGDESCTPKKDDKKSGHGH